MFWVASFGLLLSNATLADDTLENELLISFDKNWKLIKHGDNKVTEFIRDNDLLRLKSEQSVAFYTYKLPRLSQISHCDWQLEFEWRVLSASKLSSQKTKGLDDRPLAVHLWVNDASEFGWFKGGLAKLFSIPTPGYMLTYSWGSNKEWQQTFDNPHLPEKGRITVLRKAAEIGSSWHKESINISAALALLADKKLIQKRLYLAISADTEDSAGAAVSEIRKLRLGTKLCTSSTP